MSDAYARWIATLRPSGIEVIDGLHRALPGKLDAAEVKLGEPVRFGGYGEDRSLYTQALFAPEGDEPRTVHLGIDVFAPAGAAVYTPLSGRVHSSRINDNPARVLDFKQVADDVRIITLGLPANEPVQFRAGQFIDVLRPDGLRRSYSIANPPKAEGVRQLELHLRHMPGGVFTDHVFGALKQREIWKIEMPLGSFYLREDSTAPMILLASGTGFAPIQSLLLYSLGLGLTRPIHLYWGGRRKADLYALEQAQAWAQEHAHIEFIPVLSDATPDDQWQGRTGLVHQAVLQDFADLSQHQVYACGAPIMVESARRDFVAMAHLTEDAFFADSFLSQADGAKTAP